MAELSLTGNSITLDSSLQRVEGRRGMTYIWMGEGNEKKAALEGGEISGVVDLCPW